MNDNQLFPLITQTMSNNCVSACLAMILKKDIDYVTLEFHDMYMAHDISVSEYLACHNIKHRRCYSDEVRLHPGKVYLVIVPSLNIQGGTHLVVIHTLPDGGILFYDPNVGRDVKVYVPNEPEFITGESTVGLNSYIPEIEIDVEDLVSYYKYMGIADV